MSAALVILALVVLLRIGELALARRNTRALMGRGAVEVGAGHYPFIVALHAGWLFAMAIGVATARRPELHLLPLGGFVLLQFARIWVIASLGPYWTTRIVTLKGEPLVRRGPYRYLRHPNYLIVVGEIALLPLAFGQLAIAIIFSLTNIGLIVWRIRVENAALAGRPGARGSKPNG